MRDDVRWPNLCLTFEWVRGLSSAGRAPALQAGGHRFDPDRLHQPLSRNEDQKFRDYGRETIGGFASNL
jgi:hypothetical protein